MLPENFFASVATWPRISVRAATKSSTWATAAFALQLGQISFSLPSISSWASTSKLVSHFWQVKSIVIGGGPDIKHDCACQSTLGKKCPTDSPSVRGATDPLL